MGEWTSVRHQTLVKIQSASAQRKHAGPASTTEPPHELRGTLLAGRAARHRRTDRRLTDPRPGAAEAAARPDRPAPAPEVPS